MCACVGGCVRVCVRVRVCTVFVSFIIDGVVVIIKLTTHDSRATRIAVDYINNDNDLHML